MTPTPTIGIVEDNQSVRESMGALIEGWGYAAVLFESAETYLEERDSTHVDCLVLDFDLPGMNALELIEHLDEKFHEAPTIVFSGTVDAVKSEQFQQLGVLAVICKPVAGAQLMKLIESAVSV